MRPGLDNGLEECRGRWTDLLAGGDQPSRCPLAVAAVGARHMIGDGSVAAPATLQSTPAELGKKAFDGVEPEA